MLRVLTDSRQSKIRLPTFREPWVNPPPQTWRGEKEVKTVTPFPKLFSFHEAAFLLLRPLPGPAAAWVRRVSCVGRRKINGTTGRRREKERKGFLSGWL